MDNARHGVVYFSFGSLLNSRDLPDDIKEKLIEMFSGLKQTVLWKYESEISNLPGNVHVMKWAQQQSILCKYNDTFFLLVTMKNKINSNDNIFHLIFQDF